MESFPVSLTYEIELQPGEKLTLPQSLVEQIGAGSWLGTIQPKFVESVKIRYHNGFLNGYSEEDEGLYDYYPVG